MPNPSGLTPVYAFPYLLESDVPDVATASQDLAQAVENILKGMRVGTLWVGATSTLPSGVILADGSVYSQLGTYAALFAAIGTTWNTGGEGSGNFRVPDYRGRTIVGAGTGSGLSVRTLGQKFGEETHLLVVGEMPSHSHTDTGHQHATVSGTNPVVEVLSSTQGLATPGDGHAAYDAAQTASSQANLANTGGGGAHNNMQPSAVATVGIWYA